MGESMIINAIEARIEWAARVARQSEEMTIIAAAAQDWGIVWRKAEGGRFIDHTSVVTVVGPDGRERLRYGFSQLGDPQAIARDLRRILQSEGGGDVH